MAALDESGTGAEVAELRRPDDEPSSIVAERAVELADGVQRHGAQDSPSAAPNDVLLVPSAGQPSIRDTLASEVPSSPHARGLGSHKGDSAGAEERRAKRRVRQCLEAKGLDITGSGQLPVLDTYLSELVAPYKEPSTVTQYLAERLYKHHEPPQVRMLHSCTCHFFRKPLAMQSVYVT